MFTGNTWDISGINSKGKAKRFISELSNVLLINTDGGGLTGLYYRRQTNYQPLLCSLFSQTGMLLRATSGSRSLILYCWLYPSKQAINHFMLFMHLYCVLFSHLECLVEQVLTVDHSARTAGADRLLIAMTWIILKDQLTPGPQPGYKLNCTRPGAVGKL